MADVDGLASAGDPDEGDVWAGAVGRFAAWLADFSPFYRALRTPVPIPNDAPARLAAFWRTVGWAPGIGLGAYGAGFPPVPEVGRAEADRVFRRWLAAECFAPTMGLAEPTPRALWDRLPQRCWVLGATVNTKYGNCRHGGTLYYVDEDAGDDPPLMAWTPVAWRYDAGAGHDTGASPPGVVEASSVSCLVRFTLGAIAGACGMDLSLPAPERPGPFAPLAPYFWPLADGVWGVADTGATTPPDAGGAPTAIGRVVYRSARAYLDFLTGVSAERLPRHAVHVNGIHGAYEISVADAPALSPQRLGELGFTRAERDGETLVAGRMQGIPTAGFFRTGGGGPDAIRFCVAPEDVRAFRALLRRERIRIAHEGWEEPAHWWVEPSGTVRTWVARLARRVEQAAGGSARAAAGPSPVRSAPARTRRQPKPTFGSAPTEEAGVRAEAAALREWVLAACPGEELTTPGRAAGEPRLIRALWEELGYTDEFEDLVGLPDRRSSERRMARMLTTYRSRGCQLRRASLPKRFRLMWICPDDDSLLLVTDEDTPADDPPILAVDADDGVVTPANDLPSPSYLGWVGEQIARYAGQWQPNLRVRTQPALARLGTQPYPRLAPSVRHLAPGIWACPSWEVPIEGEATVGAPRFGDLVDWISRTTLVDRLELLGDDCRWYPYGYRVLQWFVPPAGLREWPAPAGDVRCYAGLIDDVPVLVTVANKILIRFAHADRERAESIITAAGWTSRPRRRRATRT